VGVHVLLYSSSNLGARYGWVVNATPRPLCSRERPGIHCAEGLVGPSVGLDGCVHLALAYSYYTKSTETGLGSGKRMCDLA